MKNEHALSLRDEYEPNGITKTIRWPEFLERFERVKPYIRAAYPMESITELRFEQLRPRVTQSRVADRIFAELHLDVPKSFEAGDTIWGIGFHQYTSGASPHKRQPQAWLYNRAHPPVVARHALAYQQFCLIDVLYSAGLIDAHAEFFHYSDLYTAIAEENMIARSMAPELELLRPFMELPFAHMPSIPDSFPVRPQIFENHHTLITTVEKILEQFDTIPEKLTMKLIETD